MCTYDQACGITKVEIIGCLLEPDQQIARSQLVERHKIGMTPIREPLQQLALEGFLQPIPQFGQITSCVAVSNVL